MRIGPQIRELVDIVAEVGQVGQLFLVDQVIAHFQLHVGDDTDEVGVAASFPVSVYCSLYMAASIAHRLQRVCHAGVAVVVSVDA